MGTTGSNFKLAAQWRYSYTNRLCDCFFIIPFGNSTHSKKETFFCAEQTTWKNLEACSASVAGIFCHCCRVLNYFGIPKSALPRWERRISQWSFFGECISQHGRRLIELPTCTSWVKFFGPMYSKKGDKNNLGYLGIKVWVILDMAYPMFESKVFKYEVVPKLQMKPTMT